MWGVLEYLWWLYMSKRPLANNKISSKQDYISLPVLSTSSSYYPLLSVRHNPPTTHRPASVQITLPYQGNIMPHPLWHNWVRPEMFIVTNLNIIEQGQKVRRASVIVTLYTLSYVGTETVNIHEAEKKRTPPHPAYGEKTFNHSYSVKNDNTIVPVPNAFSNPSISVQLVCGSSELQQRMREVPTSFHTFSFQDDTLSVDIHVDCSNPREEWKTKHGMKDECLT